MDDCRQYGLHSAEPNDDGEQEGSYGENLAIDSNSPKPDSHDVRMAQKEPSLE